MSNFYTEPFVSAGEMEFPSEPYITAQPQNHTATGPEEYVLTVIAAGAVSYQWEVFDGESWSTIPGATSDTLTINIDSSMNGWRYRVIVTGADGSTVVSKAAQIAVKGVHEITLEGAIVTFTGPARIKSLEVEINAVQDLHGQSNPYPAGGGINKFDVTTAVIGVKLGSSTGAEESNDNFCASDYIPMGENQTVYLRNVIRAAEAYCFFCYDSSKTFISGSGSGLSGGDNRMTSGVKTTVSGTAYIRIVYANTATEVACNYPSTDTAYHPYENICPISGWNAVNVFVSPTTDAEDGTTYPISLGQTVYGGVLDVTSGVLTVTKGYLVLDGDESFTLIGTAGINRRFTTSMPTNTGSNAICSHGEMIKTNSGVWGQFRCIASGSLVIMDKDSNFADVTALTTYLASNPISVVYELATPTTIQLSATEVTTLLGVNNIWADCGDIRVTIIR